MDALNVRAARLPLSDLAARALMGDGTPAAVSDMDFILGKADSSQAKKLLDSSRVLVCRITDGVKNGFLAFGMSVADDDAEESIIEATAELFGKKARAKVEEAFDRMCLDDFSFSSGKLSISVENISAGEALEKLAAENPELSEKLAALKNRSGKKHPMSPC